MPKAATPARPLAKKARQADAAPAALPACGSFTPSLIRPALYTGGKASFTASGDRMVCLGPAGALVVDPSGLGSIVHTVGGEDLVCFVLAQKARLVCTANAKGLVALHSLEDGSQVKHWASQHAGPVSEMALDPSEECLATGSADMSVRVWSMSGGFATHNFRGHKAVISTLRFHPSASKLGVLVSGDVSGAVCVWDLFKKSAQCWLRNHMSAVTGAAFLELDCLVTAGRDRVLSVWSTAGAGALLRTVPAGEALEACEALSSHTFATAGSEGAVKLWRFSRPQGECALVAVQQDQRLRVPYSGLAPCGPGRLAALSGQECVVGFVDAGTLRRAAPGWLVGFDDEMMDVCFLPRAAGEAERVVCATTSHAARVYTLGSPGLGGADFLAGHGGPVLACAAAHDFILTGSKDQTARVWSCADLRCVAVCAGHGDAVSALAAFAASRHFVTAGGEDGTVRLWLAPPALSAVGGDTAPAALQAVLQKLAHAKGITDVCVSPNDALLCTASLDKTCKVWAVSLAGRRPGLELVAELRGHRRAVNSVAFSARDRVVCTASADCTVKVWAVPEGRCVRTLEGHAAPVTQALFLAGGTSLVSAAADGALKTWDLKSSLCAQTSAAHQDKVWALALAPGPGEARLCSVGEGGELVLWRDSSEEEAARRFEQSRALVVERDALDRAVRERDFDTASRLALKLDRPHQLRTLLAGAPVGDVQRLVAGLVLACDKDRLAMLLKHVAAWNSQARSCVVAQQVLRVLLLQADGLAERLGRHVLQDFCDRVLPYTARHQARFDKLLRASYVIDHAVDLGN